MKNILAITGCDECIVDFRKATIILSMGTQVTIEDALLYPDFTRILLSYRDILKNELHIVTHEENNLSSLLRLTEMSMIFKKEYLPYCLDCTTHT
jgi:5-methylcytosine-specific restriction endonuclease McrBC regulatory subunit McrC